MNSLKVRLPQLIWEEIDNLNICISIKEIEFLIKNFPTKKNSGTDSYAHSFPGEFYQIFKEKNMPILYKLFQKTEVVGILLDSVGPAVFYYQDTDIRRNKNLSSF